MFAMIVQYEIVIIDVNPQNHCAHPMSEREMGNEDSWSYSWFLSSEKLIVFHFILIIEYTSLCLA